MPHRTKLRIWSFFNSADQEMLKNPARPVNLASLTTPETQQLIDDMAKTMFQAQGIGLAAPQIGKSLRFAVVSGELQNRSAPLVLINPTVTAIGTEQQDGEEGCLSVPGVFGLVPRASHIAVKAFDRLGQPWSLTADDLLARVIQHEVDHLNGVLFLERTTGITKGQEKLP